MFCAQQAAEFRPHLATLAGAQVDLAIIGSGAPHFARGFKQTMGALDVPIFTDETLAVYRAASMKRGLRHMLHPGQISKWKDAARYFRLQLEGDMTQQGGVVIVRPGGEVTFTFHNRFPGDHADPETVVAAALAARAS
jgi:hypothetical protein